MKRLLTVAIFAGVLSFNSTAAQAWYIATHPMSVYLGDGYTVVAVDDNFIYLQKGKRLVRCRKKNTKACYHN